MVGMEDGHIDQVLRELSETVEAFRVEYTEVRTRADRLDEEEERLLEQTPSSSEPVHATPEPHRALLSLRLHLAEQSAREHRDAFRALLAWWADAAMIAVLSVIEGVAPDPVRVAAADPRAWMTADDLERLPAISNFDRDLADLAFVMASGPTVPSGPDISDFAIMAREHAESVGLTLETTSDGASQTG